MSKDTKDFWILVGRMILLWIGIAIFAFAVGYLSKFFS